MRKHGRFAVNDIRVGNRGSCNVRYCLQMGIINLVRFTHFWTYGTPFFARRVVASLFVRKWSLPIKSRAPELWHYIAREGTETK